MFFGTPTGQTVSYSNATGRKCSNFKAETPALQNAVTYIPEMKPQKTVILTDSKAALQSLTSNTPDQSIHQLLKDLQLLPHECTVVLQWIPAHWEFQEMKEQITWPNLGANSCNPVNLHLLGSQNPALKQSKMSMEKSHRKLQPLYRPNQPSGKT